MDRRRRLEHRERTASGWDPRRCSSLRVGSRLQTPHRQHRRVKSSPSRRARRRGPVERSPRAPQVGDLNIWFGYRCVDVTGHTKITFIVAPTIPGCYAAAKKCQLSNYFSDGYVHSRDGRRSGSPHLFSTPGPASGGRLVSSLASLARLNRDGKLLASQITRTVRQDPRTRRPSPDRAPSAVGSPHFPQRPTLALRRQSPYDALLEQ